MASGGSNTELYHTDLRGDQGRNEEAFDSMSFFHIPAIHNTMKHLVQTLELCVFVSTIITLLAQL